MLNFSTQTIIPHLENKNRISGSLLPYTNLTNVATMPMELKHFQDICTDCTFLKTNKNERTICALCIKLNNWVDINAINGITKALPYTKEEMKTQPTGSLKECVTTARSEHSGGKKRFNQTFKGFNVIHFEIFFHTVSSLFFCCFSWLSRSMLWLLPRSCLSDWSLLSP